MTAPAVDSVALARSVFRLCTGLIAGVAPGVVEVDADGVRLVVADGVAGPAVVLQTSGTSSGRPRRVLIPVSALAASAAGTTERLGLPGQWISCLPAQFIGGFQVLFRAALAGVEPMFLPAGRELASALPHALASEPAGPRYISLVPAQLRALLWEPEARLALATCDAALVGGDALPASLRQDAAAAGVRVVSTYGMTETCGGCVYDGVPLSGVRVRTGVDGRVLIAGAHLVAGYLDADSPARLAADQPFVTERGETWLVTNDVGAWDGHRLEVTGRIDDVIITGGRNVAPQAVEAELQAALGDALTGWDWAVSGVPDETWGRVLVLALAPTPRWADATVAPNELLRRLREIPSRHRPRAVVEVAELPRTASGKLNRLLLAAACEASQSR